MMISVPCAMMMIHARVVTGITDPEIQNNTLINHCHANILAETCCVTPCVTP